MATPKSVLSFFILISFYHGGFLLSESVKVANSRFNFTSLNPEATKRTALESSSKALELWCVAKNNAEDSALQAALDWACGAGGADCGAIQQGGPCFEPQDIQFHTSYAFNNYFLKNGLSKQSCDFGGSAALTSLNPSRGNCAFPSSSSVRNGSYTGFTSGTITGVGPSGVDISGSQIAYMLAWPLFPALMMLLTGLTLH